MTREVKRIPFDEFAADLEKVLDQLESPEDTVLVEKSGKTFRVELDGERPPWAGIFKNYDPERMLEALRKSAGALSGVDTEQLKADIRAERGQRPRRRRRFA